MRLSLPMLDSSRLRCFLLLHAPSHFAQPQLAAMQVCTHAKPRSLWLACKSGATVTSELLPSALWSLLPFLCTAVTGYAVYN